MPYKFYELLIVIGIHKSHLGKNLTDYQGSLSSKYLKIEINITFSNILPQTVNNDTGH